MAAGNPQIKASSLPPLADALAQRSPMRPATAVKMAVALLNVVRKLHTSGRFHGQITLQSVRFDPTAGQLSLTAAGEQCELGGLGGDSDLCPPELQGAEPIRLPTSIEAAEAALAAAQLSITPRRIDLHQIAALLVQLVTGQPLGKYLRSVKMKALVPAPLQNVIERGLAFRATEQFRTCDEFLDALKAAAGALNVEVRLAPSPSTPAHSQWSPTPRPAGDPVATPVLPPDETPTGSGLPFERIGHYRVLRRLGRGGMGDVYLGHEDALQRQVAIKVLPPELAQNEDFVRRFQLEATAVAKLNHPNIVPIYFIGHEADKHFFAMQFVEGQSLDQLLASKGKLDVPETLAIVRQCLAGLGVAHRAGLIHRDVKPANILLEAKSARALVADFGLVKNASEHGVTMNGVVMGTADYIAPEQARGKDVDGRADLYSLGVMTYQMLSGRLPFNADSASAMIFQHAYEPAPPLTAPDVPPGLVRIVERLMAKEPAQRFQTCDEVSAALKTMNDAPPAASPQSTATRLSRVIRASEIDDMLARTPVRTPAPRPLMTDVGDRPEGLFARLGRMARAKAPKALKQFQTTSQQMDDALADYQERRDQIAKLVAEARRVVEELKTQAMSCRVDALAAAKIAASAENEARRQKATRDRAECEAAAVDLDQQAGEQLQELEQLEMRLAQATAELGRLRSQRDLLQLRLRAAQAELETPVNSRRERQRAILAAAAFGGALLVGIVVVSLFSSGTTPAPVVPDLGPLANVDPRPVTPITPISPVTPTTPIVTPIPTPSIPKTADPNPNRKVDPTVAIPLSPIPQPPSGYQIKGPSIIFDPPYLDFKTPTGGLQPDRPALIRGFDLAGDLAVVGHDNKFIRVWNIKEGKEIATIEPLWPIGGVQFGDKGKVFYYLGANGTLTSADSRTGQTIRKFDKINGADRFVVSHDGKRAVTGKNIGFTNGIVSFWSLDDESQTARTMNVPGRIVGMEFSPDDKRLALANEFDSLHTIDVSQPQVTEVSGTQIVAYPTIAHLTYPKFHSMHPPHFTPDGKQIYGAAGGAGIGIYHPDTKSFQRYGLTHPPEKWTRNTISAAVSPDGKWFVAGDMFRGTLSFFEAPSMTERFCLVSVTHSSNVRRIGPIRALAFTSDGGRLVVADDAGLRILDFAELLRWKDQGNHRTKNVSLVYQHELPEPAAALGLYGDNVFAANTFVHQFFYFNSFNGNFFPPKEAPPAGPPVFGKAAIAFNPVEKNKFAWVANGESTVRFAEPPPKLPGKAFTLHPAPRTDFVFSRHEKAVRALAYTPDGKKLVSGGEDGALRISDLSILMDKVQPGHGEVGRVDGFTSPIVGLAVTGNGNFIAARCLNGKCYFFKQFPVFQKSGFMDTGPGIGNVEPVGDSFIVATAGLEGMVLMDLSTGKGGKQPVKGGVASVAVSKDGKYILSGGLSGMIYLWDTSFRELYRYVGHDGPVTAIQFHDDGRYFFSAGEDRALRMFALPTFVGAK